MPPLSSLLPRRLPLPCTTAAIAVLIGAPALVLSQWPRPTARGLEQLMAISSLLQSFPADPSRQAPSLWQERLGSRQATRYWRQQRGPWWQVWSEDSGAAAALAFPAPGGSSARRPPAEVVAVDDLWVVSADPLARQLLQERLGPRRRASRGLQRRCLQVLQRQQAVFWNPTALGPLLGPLASVLQHYQEGCLALGLEGATLHWAGEAAAVDGLLSAGDSIEAPAPLASPPPLQASLLRLEGGTLQPLLSPLLSRRLIRDPLAQRYGLNRQRLPLLLQTPFQLDLQPRAQGPFQASLSLQLAVGNRGQRWLPLLTAVGRGLEQQGLTAIGPGRWRRQDGVVVGGWRWLRGPSGGEARLLITLGADPLNAGIPPGSGPQRLGQGLPASAGRSGLQLQLQPEALAQRGLLPQGLPALVQRTPQLWLRAEPHADDPSLSRLTGGLPLPQASRR